MEFKRFFPIALVGFLVLVTNLHSSIESGLNSDSVTRRLDKFIHKDDAHRPKTTEEWNKEARQTENAPGEITKRITKESGEAIKNGVLCTQTQRTEVLTTSKTVINN